MLWNRKVHYRIHKNSPLVCILGQTNPIQSIPRSILLLPTHLRLGLPSCLPLAFPTITYMRSSSPPPCVSHPFLDHFNYTWWSVQIMKFLVCGLVVRVPGYRSRDPGSIPGATIFFLRSNRSETGSTPPREYNWGATWKKKCRVRSTKSR
jgi:hypothetical protein